MVIDLEDIDSGDLPVEVAISSLTLAELAAGPHATDDTEERARRQDRLQRTEAAFDPLPFDAEAARSYGRIYAAVVAAGRKARGPRAVDLLIAATALARHCRFVRAIPTTSEAWRNSSRSSLSDRRQSAPGFTDLTRPRQRSEPPNRAAHLVVASGP